MYIDEHSKCFTFTVNVILQRFVLPTSYIVKNKKAPKNFTLCSNIQIFLKVIFPLHLQESDLNTVEYLIGSYF